MVAAAMEVAGAEAAEAVRAVARDVAGVWVAALVEAATVVAEAAPDVAAEAVEAAAMAAALAAMAAMAAAAAPAK